MMLTQGQKEVLAVFRAYPVPLPDHALVPLAQHTMGVPQTSSSIRTRRVELARKGLIAKAGTVQMPKSHRQAATFTAV